MHAAGIVTVTKYGRIPGGRRDWRHEAATGSPLPAPVPRRDHQVCGAALVELLPTSTAKLAVALRDALRSFPDGC